MTNCCGRRKTVGWSACCPIFSRWRRGTAATVEPCCGLCSGRRSSGKERSHPSPNIPSYARASVAATGVCPSRSSEPSIRRFLGFCLTSLCESVRIALAKAPPSGGHRGSKTNPRKRESRPGIRLERRVPETAPRRFSTALQRTRQPGSGFFFAQARNGRNCPAAPGATTARLPLSLALSLRTKKPVRMWRPDRPTDFPRLQQLEKSNV